MPAKIVEAYQKSPNGGVREYRNRLLFLAPSSDGHEPMLKAVRRLLALEQLRATPELLATLGEEKRADVGKQASEATGLARVAVCNHVNVLYVPGTGGLETVVLGTVTSASLVPNQTDAILERLESMEKTLVAGSKPLDPAYVRSKLGAQFDSPQPTLEVARAFARRPDLKLVLDRQQLVNLLGAGVRNGVWEYQAPGSGADGWATAAHPGPTPRLGEDTLLHPPGSFTEPGPQACPFCGQVHTGPCAKGDGAGTGTGSAGGTAGDGKPAVNRFTGSGAAGPALVSARTAAAEAGKKHVTGLRVEVTELGAGAGKELQRLLTLAPGAGPKATAVYDITARVQLDNPEHEVNIIFRGTAADYGPLKEAVRTLLNRPADFKATADLAWPQPVELHGPEVASVVTAAQSTGPTKCDISITTEDAS